MAASDGLSVAAIRAYLDSKSPSPPAPEQVRAYREAAAVLVAIKDPDHLRPLGAAPAGSAAQVLGPDLVPATGSKFNGQVMLAPAIRAVTIGELVSARRVEAALAANPDERDGELQRHFERYLRNEAPPLAEQTLDELESTLQVSVWLAGVVKGVPGVHEANARAGFLRLLAPFDAIAGDAVFRGRRGELDELRGYIGVLPPESWLQAWGSRLARWAEPERQPAVSISGIGGAGKSSLVARFMLEHTRLPEEGRVPFGYLDFARPELDIGDPAGLCRELGRQLDLQFPGMLAAADLSPSSAASSSPDATGLLFAILDRLRQSLGPRPYVVVLDTFEEVQYRGEERALPFWKMLTDLQDKVAPFLRVVVAGRAPVRSLQLARRPPREIRLGDLDVEAAMAFLGAQGIEDPRTQRQIIAVFGQLPLSLKLVATLARRTPGGADALLDPAVAGFALLTASDEVLQAQVYGRILDHIADERVRRLAHPGLTLRRLNPRLILDVLNEPCGLGIGTMEEAAELFEELRRESSLVSVDSNDGDLVHRADLRRVMLKMLLTGAPAQVEQIRRRAAAWYADHPGRRGRAEEVYHRLHLGEPVSPRELRDSEVRASTQAAIGEFPVEVQLRLATEGFEVPASVIEQASRDQAHAALASQVEQLLPYGPSSQAQARDLLESANAELSDDRPVFRSVFGPRADRGASPVFRASARVAAQRGDEEEALDLIERGLARAARDGASVLTLGLLQERAWLYRRRDPAEQAEGLAALGEHARRHQDRAAQIQHRAQLINPLGPVAGTDVAALADLLSQADPLDLWALIPGLQPVVSLSRALPGVSALLGAMRNLVLASDGPFGLAVLPEPGQQSALDRLTQAAYLASSVDDLRDLRGLRSAFVGLCGVWPYRILYVDPPYGSRGERLTLA